MDFSDRIQNILQDTKAKKAIVEDAVVATPEAIVEDQGAASSEPMNSEAGSHGEMEDFEASSHEEVDDSGVDNEGPQVGSGVYTYMKSYKKN